MDQEEVEEIQNIIDELKSAAEDMKVSVETFAEKLDELRELEFPDGTVGAELAKMIDQYIKDHDPDWSIYEQAQSDAQSLAGKAEELEGEEEE